MAQTIGTAQRKWIQILHIAKSELSLDDAAYRAVLYGAAGVDSARDIKTWQQYNDVLKAFANLGFKVKAGKSAQTGLKKTAPQTGRSGDWISARQEYYIRGLWDLASRAKDEASLQAMLQRIAGVKYIQWISKDNATKVILALRDIAKKAGYNPDAPAKAGMKEK
mgnify:FL=1